MQKPDVASKVTEVVLPLALSLGLELVDVEYLQENRRMVLRIYIDKEGGLTLDDCAVVSRELGEILDVEDFIRGKYTLEVSSPGINRQLKCARDYERFMGRLVKIRTFEPFPDDKGNRRKTFLGVLAGFANDMVELKLNEGQNASIPLDKIAKANLEFEI
jgi:ribosome maturation factor RimP